MNKFVSATCIVVVVLLILGSIPAVSAKGVPASAAQNKAAWIAKQFVLKDETYRFDGMPNTLAVAPSPGTVSIMGFGAMAMPRATRDTYTFKVNFDSQHAGFGDRAGAIMAEAITPHIALITVKSNKVISATMDGKWNMLTEKPI